MADEFKFCDNCVFCLSKCPQCGSTSVEIEFVYANRVYFYENDMEDQIGICHSGDSETDCDICWGLPDLDENDLGIRCDECDYESNSIYTDINTFRPDEAKLLDAIVKIFEDYDKPPGDVFLKIGERYKNKDGTHSIKIEVRAAR